MSDFSAPRAILAGLNTGETEETFERTLSELSLLAKTLGIKVTATLTQNAEAPQKATYIGSGKLAELKAALAETESDLVIFDETLTPMQFRNLSKELSCEVLDRTGLILRIFSEQARTREARLQVEHANLQYIMPRLAGMWTHFGRQGGTSGAMSNRGVGETQLELDRRHIERRMAELEKELKSIEKERMTQRDKRLSSALPKVALVGYTNAGKSTLMNRLLEENDRPAEEKKVLEKDALFATLDTTVRHIAPKGGRPFLLTDTVGFIDELPHSLVKAFRSTLEEVKYADLLLMVVDISDPGHEAHIDVTAETLKEIGAGTIPRITVYNKTDRRDDLPFALPAVHGDAVYLSAASGSGIGLLLDKITEKLEEEREDVPLLLPYARGDLLSRLKENGDLRSAEYREDGVYAIANLGERERAELRAYRL